MPGAENPVRAVRRFNRFYTHKIGLLGEGHLRSPFSLTEVRVLYELAHRAAPVAAEIGKDLGLDAGYLSRILRNFRQRGLVKRTRSESDGRQSRLELTPRGKAAFQPLDRAASREIGALLKPLPVIERGRVVTAMRTITHALGGDTGPEAAVVLRRHRPGDMGWVVHRHGVLYAQEQGWDERFEAVVAEIAARFVQNFDPRRERCWIAERDGEILGSVFLVRESEVLARLRLLLVEPAARSLGIGRRLVEECIRFARAKGYRTLTLWTNDVLVSARRIYQAAGFQLVQEERHHSFGQDLVGQNWDLDLRA